MPFMWIRYLKESLPIVLRCPDAALGQHVAQPGVSLADVVHHGDHGVIIAEAQIDTVGVFAREDACLIEFHCPGDKATDLQVVNAVLVDKVVAHEQRIEAVYIPARRRRRPERYIRDLHRTCRPDPISCARGVSGIRYLARQWTWQPKQAVMLYSPHDFL